MKRILLAAAAFAVAAPAFAQDPQPSFKDTVDLPKQVVTGDRTVEQSFPKSSYAGGGGPKGPATVLIQSEEPVKIRRQAVVPQPSFNG